MNLPPPQLSPEEQSVNFIYHVYAAVFDNMQLSEVDKTIYYHVPKCLWDNDCYHYHTCMHELAWKQFCCNILNHILDASKHVFPKPSKGVDTSGTDILDILTWCCYNTNAVHILVNMYSPLRLNELLHSSHKDAAKDLHEIFIKYLKIKELNI